MEKRQLQTPRGAVCYWVGKEYDATKATLVFLHGLTADHTLFDKQVEFFSPAYNVLTWDAPAHGASRPYADFTYAHAAADLKAILDAEGVASALLIGQSMGGFISQSFLLRYPEMVTAFIGVDTCPYGEAYYSRSDKWWLRQVEWMARLYPLGVLKRAIARSCTQTPYACENMRAALAPYGKRELCRLMGIGFAGFLEDNRDMDIPCPVLILCGENDTIGKARQYCKAWAGKTGYPLTMIKNAGHNANADNPEQVNACIQAFLQSL